MYTSQKEVQGLLLRIPVSSISIFFFFIYALILLVATPNTDDLWCNGYQKRNYQKLFSNISTSSGSHWYNEILDSYHFFRSKIYNFNIEPFFYKNRIIHPALYMSLVWPKISFRIYLDFSKISLSYEEKVATISLHSSTLYLRTLLTTMMKQFIKTSSINQRA